jgi:FkbM family methyltransferase
MHIRYREDFQAWWPDYDHAPEKNFFLVKRNLTDMDVAARYCRHKRVAIQAGGHAGFWPKRLKTMFHTVWTFECEPTLYECMRLNCQGTKGIYMNPSALGDTQGLVKMKGHCSAGSWRIDPDGDYEVNQTTIDSYKFKDVDAIFLDVEGYEDRALRGARETIAACRPVIMVEELPRSRAQIAATLDELGYKFVKAVHKDKVYVPKERRV